VLTNENGEHENVGVGSRFFFTALTTRARKGFGSFNNPTAALGNGDGIRTSIGRYQSCPEHVWALIRVN
jgi:hypothetical protein